MISTAALPITEIYRTIPPLDSGRNTGLGFEAWFYLRTTTTGAHIRGILRRIYVLFRPFYNTILAG